jgi:TolB protein
MRLRHTALVAVAVGLAIATMSPMRVSTRETIGWFEEHRDIGQPAIAGSTEYDPDDQTYTITGAGTNMWAAHDEFQFAWRRMRGDFIVRAHARFLGQGVDPHRKMGWIVRKTLDADSPYADAAIHGDGLTSLQFRRTPGAETEQVESTMRMPDVVQLERRDGTYIMSVARFGERFTQTELTGVDLGDEVYVGLFVCSHNPEVSETAVFSNVRIVVPPEDGWQPYRDYIGSHLEVMTVDDGRRTVLHTAPDSFQAPNWTTDGRTLIYNHNGLLKRFDLTSNTVSDLDTGFADRNNNDHVLSFDGRMLGISHHSADDDGRSVIYTLPATGGTPKRVTERSPSYLHSWSPDGRFLIYTGGRDDEYDIYRIPVEGGDEVNLTRSEGLDDGSEYTPDGEWIYFNSARTGTMQIWRMRPDGSQQEQITDDDLNNWFPHISPDGASIVFLSYLPDVAADDHPFYRQVYLRLMKIDGSDQKIIAYIFGGQGTINVPSWSPDSKRIAFVSNSALTAPH